MRIPGLLALIVAIAACSCQAYDRAHYEQLLDAARDGDAGADITDGADSIAMPDASSDGDDVVAVSCDGGMLCGEACADITSDPANCGGCGIGCPGVIGGTRGCVQGMCAGNCPAGRHLCFAACVDDTSLDTCGTACSPCAPRTHAIATCDGTACRYACEPGFGDCDGDLTSVSSNGCETPLNTASDCGACGSRCASTAPLCTEGGVGATCTLGCSSQQMACGSSCVDVSSDPAHCGSCTACPTRAHASARCTNGSCSFVCASGFGDCNGSASDGCETDTRASAANCGSCGHACGSIANGTNDCVAGVCRATCAAGYVAIGNTCSDFGGAFSLASSGCPACLSANVVTGDCSCPAGFVDITRNAQVYCGAALGTGTTHFCVPPAPTTTAAFAGAFELVAPTAPCAAGECLFPNEQTGNCACPSGSTAVISRVRRTPGGCSTVDAALVICVRTSNTTSDFKGAYETFDQPGVTPACVDDNPYTGSCSCPLGSRRVTLPVRATSTSPAQVSAATIHVCVR